MLRLFLYATMLGVTLASTGCMTAAKQAYYGVTGAAGEFYELSIVDPEVLADYEGVKIEPFTNALGPHTPTSVINEVNRNLPSALYKEGLFSAKGRKLVITGEIKHYTGQSGLSGSVASILGGMVCVCRVQLRDSESNEMIGEAMCWGEVKSALRQGSNEFGSGVAKGVAKWIVKRLPEGEVERRKEANLPKD